MKSGTIGDRLEMIMIAMGLKQYQFAEKFGVARNTIIRYIHNERYPEPEFMVRLADLSININWLLKGEGSMYLDSSDPSLMTAKTKKKLQLLNAQNTLKPFTEQILQRTVIMPVAAEISAGTPMPVPDDYEFSQHIEIPRAMLHGSPDDYYVFRVNGNSMEPLPSGSYIICEYLQNWNEVKNGKTYVLVTQHDGVVYKRVFINDNDTLLLKSDNPEYTPYTVSVNTLSEVWKALGYICFSLPEPDEMHMGKLTAMVYKMQGELDELIKHTDYGN